MIWSSFDCSFSSTNKKSVWALVHARMGASDWAVHGGL
jgi:hypothetical protein